MPKVNYFSFKYDVKSLIQQVKIRSCLWDNRELDKKAIEDRLNAWMEIGNYFEQDFQSFDHKKKREICKSLQKKWMYTRDAFQRNLKSQPFNLPKKRYIYHNELNFLLDSLNELGVPEDGKSTSHNTVRRLKKCSERTALKKCEGDTGQSISSPSSSTHPFTSQEENVIAMLPSLQSQSVLDEDESFLMSILPAIKRMTEDEKYEFRIQVTNVIRQIRKRSTSPIILSNNMCI